MRIYGALGILLILVFCELAIAEKKDTDGAHIYKEVCSACHAGGVANAPKLGDKNAWEKLIAEGQVIITAHGYVGVRAMPPKGGKSDLTLQGFSEALNYMVNQSGGHWKKPDKNMMSQIDSEIMNRKKAIAN